MKHIRNSINGVYFLQNKGVPVSSETDFNQPIKKGSLCVDNNNADLYIRKENSWELIASNLSGGDFIPLAGTDVGKPVSGLIEMSEDTGFTYKTNQVIFRENGITFHFTNEDNDFVEDIGVNFGKDVIFRRDNAITSIDSESNENFVYLLEDNLTLVNSHNNTILNKAKNVELINTDNSILRTNAQNIQIDSMNSVSVDGLYREVLINGTNSTIGIKNNVYLKGANFYDLSSNTTYPITINDSFDLFLEGFMKNLNIEKTSDLFIIGNMNNLNSIDNYNVYVFGKNDNLTLDNSNSINLIGNSTNNNFLDINKIYSLGSLINSDFRESFNSNDVLLGNIEGLNVKGSVNNLYLNFSYSDIEESNKNIFLNSTNVNSTSSVNNLISGVDTAYLQNSQNNLIFGDSLTLNGTTGSNNIVLTLNNEIELGDYNFLYGNINTETNQLIKNGNIVLGNVDLNNTLTENNMIIGAKRIVNINHDLRSNNIFLNVDNFDVPEEDTVYLPLDFFSVGNNIINKFQLSGSTQDNTYTFPDKSGTIALLDDINVNIDIAQTFTNDPIENEIIADFTGQVGVNTSGADIYISYGVEAGEWYLVSIKPLKSLYVDGNNPYLGDGSITNPFKTIKRCLERIDMVGDFLGFPPIVIGSDRITVEIAGYKGVNYIISENMYRNGVDWNLNQNAVVNYDGDGYLFDCSSAGSVGAFSVRGFGTFELIDYNGGNTPVNSLVLGFLKVTNDTCYMSLLEYFKIESRLNTLLIIDNSSVPTSLGYQNGIFNIKNAENSLLIANGIQSSNSLSGVIVDYGTITLIEKSTVFFNNFKFTSSKDNVLPLTRLINSRRSCKFLNGNYNTTMRKYNTNGGKSCLVQIEESGNDSFTVGYIEYNNVSFSQTDSLKSTSIFYFDGVTFGTPGRDFFMFKSNFIRDDFNYVFNGDNSTIELVTDESNITSITNIINTGATLLTITTNSGINLF
jgi:hypothetical protein